MTEPSVRILKVAPVVSNRVRRGPLLRGIVAGLLIFSSTSFGQSVTPAGPCYEGIAEYYKKNYELAARYYRAGAEKGDVICQFNLGVMYEIGIGIPRDLSEAVRLYKASSDLGHSEAPYRLGYMYLVGNGVTKDYSEAAKLFSMSARKGHLGAKFELGRLYQQGTGVPKDLGEAVRLFREAAERRHPYSQYSLGLLYETGQGVSKDTELAKANFEQALANAESSEEVKALVRKALSRLSDASGNVVTSAASPPKATQLAEEVAELREELARVRKEQLGLPSQTTSTVPRRAPRLSAHALVIGNGAYSSFGRLANPRNDATAIAARFREFGITVQLVLDADRDALIKSLNEYSQRAAGQDVNVLFYAGHGVQVEGVNYVIPTNMRADGITAGYIKLAGLSLNAILDYLPAKTRLVFLDACRDNPASRSLVASRSAGSLGLAPMSAPSGTLIAYATRDGATAEDGAGKHSPYTTALLQHLGASEDIGLVLRKVRQSVMKVTSSRQEPWEYGSLVGGELVLSQMARRQ